MIAQERLKPSLESGWLIARGFGEGSNVPQSVADFPDFIDVWTEHQPETSPRAVTVVPTKGFAMVGGIIEINLMGLTNGAKRKKEVLAAEIPAMGRTDRASKRANSCCLPG